jgi:hypothetical protein
MHFIQVTPRYLFSIVNLVNTPFHGPPALAWHDFSAEMCVFLWINIMIMACCIERMLVSFLVKVVAIVL